MSRSLCSLKNKELSKHLQKWSKFTRCAFLKKKNREREKLRKKRKEKMAAVKRRIQWGKARGREITCNLNQTNVGGIERKEWRNI